MRNQIDEILSGKASDLHVDLWLLWISIFRGIAISILAFVSLFAILFAVIFRRCAMLVGKAYTTVVAWQAETEHNSQVLFQRRSK